MLNFRFHGSILCTPSAPHEPRGINVSTASNDSIISFKDPHRYHLLTLDFNRKKVKELKKILLEGCHGHGKIMKFLEFWNFWKRQSHEIFT